MNDVSEQIGGVIQPDIFLILRRSSEPLSPKQIAAKVYKHRERPLRANQAMTSQLRNLAEFLDSGKSVWKIVKHGNGGRGGRKYSIERR